MFCLPKNQATDGQHQGVLQSKQLLGPPGPWLQQKSTWVVGCVATLLQKALENNTTQTLFLKQNISYKFTPLYPWFCNGWGLAIFQDTLKASFFLVLVQSICYHFKNKSNVFNRHTLLSPKFKHVSFAQAGSYSKSSNLSILFFSQSLR